MVILRSIRMYLSLFLELARLYVNIFFGIVKISKLHRSPVTIFGGARLKADSIFMKKATELSHKLASSGIPVLTGGGPGIMEAASCGAFEVKRRIISTIGITVKGLNTEAPSSCQPDIIIMQNYAARKWLLIQYSRGFVVFPGGFGTLNELTDILTLIQTKLRVPCPIILIGKEYWKPLIDWITLSALQHELISPEDMKLFIITDDIDEAFKVLKAHAHKYPKFTP